MHPPLVSPCGISWCRDAAAGRHPLHVAGAQAAAVAEDCHAVLDGAGQHVGDRFDPAMWVPWKPGQVVPRVVVAEVVEQQGRIEFRRCCRSRIPAGSRAPAPSRVGLGWMTCLMARTDIGFSFGASIVRGMVRKNQATLRRPEDGSAGQRRSTLMAWPGGEFGGVSAPQDDGLRAECRASSLRRGRPAFGVGSGICAMTAKDGFLGMRP